MRGYRPPARPRRRGSSSSLTGCARRPRSAAGTWRTSTSTVMTATAAPVSAGRGWTGSAITRRWPSWTLSLVTAPDRLARNYVHQVLLIDELAGRGCQVEFLDRPMSADPHDQLLLQIRGAVAEYENYAELGIVLVMPTARLCRPGGEMAARRAPAGRLSWHNHRPSRKASRVSDGL